ncbi:BTAD domain-containing putative transcriptional regulator [Micromonospora sp. WMMD1120]|uniref:AfsR/SARP family transcriptional regulator n=1 Tax=Micromonospora sp. WMMD1120 TaxID=3016106 RepID=UPI002417416B|nr:AfsR/SARP family transcriptional regulator [Micromonospora sp. WMMD1120]MDG4809525.1 BTAD domain-containing putative transcriptional regulator [Micromonospora sp. WMMD1120]
MTGARFARGARHPLPASLRWTEAPASRLPGELPAMVEFHALGPLEAVVAGQLANLGTPKQRALLALLVSRIGQPVAVEMILETLWAGHPPRSAMTSLQAYIANLRRVLEPDRGPRKPAAVLRTCPGGYLLDGRVVDVDVRRFGEHATAGWQAWDRDDPSQALTEFEAALALWRGGAYSEVASVAHVAGEVARLEELRLSVIEARCAALLAVGAHARAVPELEALVQAHPLREYGCELLSLTLYRTGRQADALGVLRTVQQRLADEVGVDPRPALQLLQHEILSQTPGPQRPAEPAATPSDASTGSPGTSIPDADVFVGRERELRQLAAASAAAAAGRGRVVTVYGESGIGKTRLLRHFAALTDAPVLWGACPEHVQAPAWWLWEQVLRAAVTAFPGQAVPATLSELLAGHRWPARADAALRAVEEIVRYLTDIARDAPLVVVLDHVHRADPSSLRLLAHLADSAATSRLLVIVSYRAGESPALAETLAALARAGATGVELDGLDVDQVHDLARAVLDREVDRQAADELWDRGRGNPFFVRALLTQLGGVPDPEHVHPAPVPAPIREVVLHRVARLPTVAAELLPLAAVAGRHFDIAIVAEAASTGIETALAAMDAAVAAGLLVEDRQRLGWFRFTHPVTADVLYETTGRLRRLRRHRRIGAAAARAWAGDPVRAAETARHWLLAAELDPATAARAVPHAVAAARVADTNLAFDDAAAWWRQALATAELTDRARLDRYPLLVGLGTSLCRAGNHHDGLPALVEAMEEALPGYDGSGDGDAARLVTAAIAAVGELTSYPIGHGAIRRRLLAVLEHALPQVTDAAQRSLLGSCLAVVGNHDRGRRPGAPA